jgi:DNA-binding NarL/FixJ family response regulator
MKPDLRIYDIILPVVARAQQPVSGVKVDLLAVTHVHEHLGQSIAYSFSCGGLTVRHAVTRAMMRTVVTAKKNVLIVGVSTPALQRAGSLLSRGTLRVSHAANGQHALELARSAAFDLLIVRYPLAGTSLPDVIEALRAPESVCRQTSILILAEEDHAAELSPLLGHGINRIVSTNAPSERLLDAVAELLAVAPRRAMRVPVRLSLLCERKGNPWAGETVDVSTTGMLVVSGYRPRVGSGIGFELFLPDSGVPVAGQGEVVRHGEAPLGSFAVRYLSFSVDSWQRLHNFLAEA